MQINQQMDHSNSFGSNNNQFQGHFNQQHQQLGMHNAAFIHSSQSNILIRDVPQTVELGQWGQHENDMAMSQHSIGHMSSVIPPSTLASERDITRAVPF